MMRKSVCTLGVLAACLCCGSAALGNAPFFTGLGNLAGGSFDSRGKGLSPDGSVVAGFSYTASGQQGFRWTSSEGMVGLGYLPGGSFASNAVAASANGAFIVGGSDSGNAGPGDWDCEAFRWSATDGMIALGDLPGGNFDSFALAVSADGSVIVGRGQSDSGTEAFRWTATDGMVGLGDLPGGTSNSTAYGVSQDGAVVVGTGKSDSGTEAFRWTAAEGMVGLGDLLGGSFHSKALDVSADGSVIVGEGTAFSEYRTAFRWTSADGMVGLGDLPGGDTMSVANGVSADGSIVVGRSRGVTGDEAFIWDDANGMRSLQSLLIDEYGLDLTGWTLREAAAVSDDGLTFTGYGINAAGRTEAWVAHIPEPATLSLLALGGLALARRRRV